MPREAVVVVVAHEPGAGGAGAVGPVTAGSVGDGEQRFPHVGGAVGDAVGHLGPAPATASRTVAAQSASRPRSFALGLVDAAPGRARRSRWGRGGASGS